MVANDRNPQRFSLGEVVITTLAVLTLDQAGECSRCLLDRHAAGDWGELSQEEYKRNDWAVDNSEEVLSAYRMVTGETIYVITSPDRSRTIVMHSDEFDG